ncbi:hypothetical protein P255_01411 [Acinetobacter brisouii CIP 110357]|uniref:Uncharacterized protein n=1 Tax=Acinetobacter brisouii CIP 110357 TaxID=1341683 RepID=V2ULR8_9GAMM|nr:hypothetical protein [Acinetobacter brisouii]ENV46063.1 hypothetical protein F954_02889 [Acinetobacter brisouii ANC 4119]ESK50912.1 hypothetical protein P255_01411 [Acinetobacter brisouii CIP 110357]
MMTAIQEIKAKFYQLIIIVLTVLILILGIGFVVQTWRVSHWKTQSENADAKCLTQIQKIEQTQQTALKQANDKANQASADYEKLKATQQVKIQTVRDTVQKIVERPVYRNVCFDDSGMQQLGKAISLGQTKLSSELDDTVPKPDNSE